jgi:hypothetical protein
MNAFLTRTPLVPSGSSRNGPGFTATRSWQTGNSPARASPFWPSRPCPSIRDVSNRYLPVVTGVAVTGDHLLRLLFSDGTAGDVDFSGQHWDGVLEPLSDPGYFARVTVDAEAGTIAWPDGIDLAPEPLYEEALAHPLVAV